MYLASRKFLPAAVAGVTVFYMATRAFLSKSTFIRGVQCEKSLYLHKKRPFLRDRLSAEQLAKFARGHKVGYLARDLYPGGIDVSPASHYQMAASVKKTAELIQSGVTVIYEAAFEYNGVCVALDILHKENGLWKAVEVKSSAAISETFLWDVSLQYYVICGSGLELSEFSIAYINAGYVRHGAIEIHKLFIVENLIDLVKKKQVEVDEHVERFRKVSFLNSSPDMGVGPHCHSPYPCDFKGHCWKKITDVQFPRALIPDLEAIASLKSIDRQNLALFSSMWYEPAIPPYDRTSPYHPLAYSFAVNGYNQLNEQARVLIAPPAAAFSPADREDLLQQMEQYSGVIVFDRDAELDHLAFIAGNDERKLQRIMALSAKMHGIKHAFNGKASIVPVITDHTCPGEIFQSIGAVPPKPDCRLKTRLEASLLYGEMAGKQDSAADVQNMEDLKAFHRFKLVCLEKLFQTILDIPLA